VVWAIVILAICITFMLLAGLYALDELHARISIQARMLMEQNKHIADTNLMHLQLVAALDERSKALEERCSEVEAALWPGDTADMTRRRSDTLSR
jgi:hypothetical protein